MQTMLPSPHQPLSEAEIYAIKRQYLGLLPPQQVIDICLTLEAHAPLHVKSSVWPYDIRAAIAFILAQKSQARTSPESETPSKTSSPPASSSSGEKTTQSQPSSSQQSTSVSSTSQPGTSQIPSGYPQQPYFHPAYPHTSYYTSPHATYSYPHPYPSYPQPYPVNLASHHPPLFTNTPLVHSPHPAPEPPPPLNNVDDLPSYEEMIVEALLDSGDPEGCAPKSLFSWMAMHYPLQMNFRPSASQALQKAYKRGRLEKGSNGKYRLNENWEGGNTSRRTTRRPQTLAQITLPVTQPSSSPFTHTPLVPHAVTNLQARPPHPGQLPGYGGYPFGHPYQGSSSSARDSLGTGSQKQVAENVDHETVEGGDAWEAAQNILKAINFEQLFQISSEENKAWEPSALISQQASADRPDKTLLASGTAASEELSCSHVGKSAELNAEQRAALQAQLALLAAQLAELADVSEDELSHTLEVSQKSTTTSCVCIPHGVGEGSSVDNGGNDDDSEDMIEVTVPTTSLAA